MLEAQIPMELTLRLLGDFKLLLIDKFSLEFLPIPNLKEKLMKLQITALALALSTIGLLAQESHHHNHSQQMECKTSSSAKPSSAEILDLMHSPMMCTSWVESGNIDQDFVYNMIPHHKGAILSSEAILKITKNPKVKKIAIQIAEGQKKEIKEFYALLKQLPKAEAKDYESFAKKAKEDMNKMMEEMASVRPSGDTDKDFLTAMISHHQGAIDAAKQILDLTNNSNIKKVAQHIIKEQEKEIKEIKEALK